MNEEIAREIAATTKAKPSTQRTVAMKRMIEEQFMKEPENVAGTLRGWLHEN
jgi:hypothetical protein